jgi:hypothetical protein
MIAVKLFDMRVMAADFSAGVVWREGYNPRTWDCKSINIRYPARKYKRFPRRSRELSVSAVCSFSCATYPLKPAGPGARRLWREFGNARAGAVQCYAIGRTENRQQHEQRAKRRKVMLYPCPGNCCVSHQFWDYRSKYRDPPTVSRRSGAGPREGRF